MTRAQHIRRIFASLLFFVAFCALSCKQVIDNLLTFDVDKTSDIPVTPLIPPEGFLFALPGIPIPLDSTELAQHKTAFSLLKMLKLTKLKFTPDDPSYSNSNIDTLRLSVGTDSLSANNKLLATCSGSLDNVSLTNADFADEAKNSKAKFFVVFRVKKSPSHDIKITAAYTLTFTASPL